ncbi:sulfite exporter TauE/SafE family protein [Gilvimarinus sp. SDUM040013]|uniref:Probable membrane transporter protein n=1 Tax=Gilvimarinus gilvus TaxID=3058038 RepID=A0ABU4S1X6_9GAMM|nr:sulfite exporter TauE/SafE family protein [Gilvimarinus sp. SDUM040013]MDO3387780.1 sulfite exporter TauE/SafE family protein [Gilvimarinus sp. SDUM040013]MDX6851077.1 sulfite exporter TauE/SafE family protein [Gilvimarinus sp. SDUM040013]
MIDQWIFYALAVPVVLLVGLSKGGFGGGLGSLAVPVLSLAVDPRLAAAVLLPILCSMDLVSLWSFRGKWDKRNLLIMFPAAMIGLALGAAMFTYMDADKIRFMVGVMALYFVGHYVWGKHVLQRVAVQKASVVRGSFWSTVAGFVSYIAHAGGPPISIYLLPQHLPKTLFVGTTVLFFSVVNYIKLVPYVWMGQLNLSALYTSLVLLPLAPIGVWLGVWLHHRVSDKWFYGVCYVLLAFAGVKLVGESLMVWLS